MASRLAELRLRPGADLVLATISRDEGLTQTELARRLGVSRPNVTKVLRTLERGRLVERLGDPHDGRISHVHLTPAGAQARRAVERAWRSAERETLAELSDAEAATLRELLAKALRRQPRPG